MLVRMAEPVFQSSITAHAWDKDHKLLAICPNSSDVFIYDTKGQSSPKNWKKMYTLSEHSMTVTDIDWNHATNSIVTSSQDRNAYVWTLQNNVWEPALVTLRIGRAATCARWSPDGKKFAVGSGSKQIPVCHYEDSQSMWVAKMIKKAGKSSILCVDWSPNNLFLITGGSDFKCRIFSAYVKGVDEDCKVDDAYSSVFKDNEISNFGTMLAEFDQSHGWIEACRFSPDGLRFAFCGHDSSVHFGEIANGQIDVQSILRRELPNRAIAFLNDTRAIAGGYDNVPIVYQYSNGKWTEKGPLDTGKSGNATTKKKSAFSNAKNMFQQQSSLGQKGADAALPTRHQNIINDIIIVGGNNFSTSSVDGRVLLWDASKQY